MLNYISKQKAIVLYWDMPESYSQGDRFEILLDGRVIGQTEKCHFEAESLCENSEYEFSVFMNGKDTTELGSIFCRTQPSRNCINVAKPPYNAVGDGKTLNTAAIQRAIDDCGAGECVYIPAGDFMTGSLRLHSDMELYLEKGAILHGTADVKDYEPKIKSRFEGIEMMCYAALLNIGELERDGGYNCKNVRICGEGTVCGGGRPLAENVVAVEKVLLKDYMDSLGDKLKECENDITIPGRPRPRLINVSCAQNVTVYGITVMNGASWNFHMIYSENVVTYGCTFRSSDVWNGDGWDPDSSTNCTIFGSEFYTGDDAVAIKSGKNPEGNVINRPCEHIRVFDCVSHYGHGITIGSEMSGGINDIRIWNCDMSTSVFGIEIKATKKRGGYVRNVHVRNTKACRVLMHSVGYNDDGEAAPDIPVFEDCLFEDMQITAVMRGMDNEDKCCQAIELAGFDEEGHFIKNVKFKNILIDSGESRRQSIYLQCCDGVSLENIKCR